MTIRSIADRRWNDLRDSLTTIPHWKTWRACAIVYALFLTCAVPIGLRSGLLRPGVPPLAPTEMIGAGLLLFVHPALVEEIVFRALLLPRDFRSMARGRLIVIAGVSLVLYVAAHPLAARLFRPEARSLFESPVYLTLAALLGLACTATYLISRSLWPSVAIHWLTVVTWIWFLGGHALLC